MTSNELAALKAVSLTLGIPPSFLDAIISFESSWNPQAKNPSSSAKGLIQFTDATAKWLGFKSSADLIDRFPTTIQQLSGPVKNYLSRFKPFPTFQSLALAIFYPKLRNAPEDTAFPDYVRKANPGINTISDYLNKIRKYSGSIKAAIDGFVSGALNMKEIPQSWIIAAVASIVFILLMVMI